MPTDDEILARKGASQTTTKHRVVGQTLRVFALTCVLTGPARAADGFATPVPLPTVSALGVGNLTAVPAGATNGTLLPATNGARFYLPSGSSVSFTIATSAPTAAPAAVFTISPSATGPNWDENLAGSARIYITATTGSPLFRAY